MAINFKSLSKAPHIFSQLTGLTVIEFEKVVKRLDPVWEKLVEQKKCHGRNSPVPGLSLLFLELLI